MPMKPQPKGRIGLFYLPVLLAFLIILLICTQGVADVAVTVEKPSLHIQRLFKKYLLVNDKTAVEFQVADNSGHFVGFPGWIVGKCKINPDGLFFENWRYRNTTYEIYFFTKAKLAQMIYDLAIFSKDLDKSVSLARFKKGAQGFHYSTEQVVTWANVLSERQQNIASADAKAFLEKLHNDKVLFKSEGSYSATGRIQHIIGAAPGKKRRLALNLNHERWHVMWDENSQFRELYLGKWQSLSDSQKKTLLQGFIGYNQEREMQIVEEWAVKKNERVSLWN